MARHERGKLSALEVERKKKPGRYGDAGGLYLQVTSAGARSWIFRYRPRGGYLSKNGKPLTREMGLGSLHVTSLSEARARAAKYRQALRDGIDPLEAERINREQAHLAAAKSLTFEEAAEAYMAAHRAGWRNARHAEQWSQSLAQYAYPVIGHLSVASIDTTLVMRVIEPLWATTTETGSRVRGRIERVLAWATVRGYRNGENAARWRNHLDALLPKRSKVAKTKHHAALAYIDIAGFMEELRQHSGIAARALEFTILTAGRSGEVLGAKWPEIDEATRLWTVPADRMKGGRSHRVPLSAQALAVLEQMKSVRQGDYIFPGHRRERLSTMAMYLLLRQMRPGVTTHGMRACFRTWVSERTNFPPEVAEAALAHISADKLEQAYARGDLLERRKRLMAAWAEFCGQPQRQQKQADIVQLHA
jgi:integrase